MFLNQRLIFFFCGGRGLNLRPCIYYTLSKPTELNSRGQSTLDLIIGFSHLSGLNHDFIF